MVAKSFVVAMAADIARSDYAKPTLIRSRSREWLIACRRVPTGHIFLCDGWRHVEHDQQASDLDHTKSIPPSSTMLWPVIDAASSDAR
jgi:hypothetical protein